MKQASSLQKHRLTQTAFHGFDSSFSVHTIPWNYFHVWGVCEIKSTLTQHAMFACEWKPYRECHITYLLYKTAVLLLSAANKPIVSC